MSSAITVLDGGNEAGQLKLKRDEALAKVAAKKAAQTPKQKKQSLKRRDDKIAALSVRNKAVFNYVDNRIAQVPMTQKVATQIGIKLTDVAIIKLAGRRVLGDKSVGKMKNKRIRVSYGYSFVTNKKATRGKSTGRARTKSISSGLVRRWTTINVPLDANTLDILNWIESQWKKIPQICVIGQQEYRLRTAAKAAQSAKDLDGKKLITT
jgi:hypothetical protein